MYTGRNRAEACLLSMDGSGPPELRVAAIERAIVDACAAERKEILDRLLSEEIVEQASGAIHHSQVKPRTSVEEEIRMARAALISAYRLLSDGSDD